MKKDMRWVGLDMHAETIAVAVAEGNGDVRSLGRIPNRPEAIRHLVKKLGRPGEVAGVLRSRADGIRPLLAARGTRGEL